jgi:hypothetical protein
METKSLSVYDCYHGESEFCDLNQTAGLLFQYSTVPMFQVAVRKFQAMLLT